MKPYLLVLENFQSLRERTEIPIGPLTFLYGPNSAGKSCVDDAFSLFSAVFSDKEKDPNALLQRWAHYAPAAIQPIERQESITYLALHCQVGRIFTGMSHTGRFGEIVQSESGLTGWFEKSGWNIVLGLEGTPNGISALTMTAGNETVFRIDHIDTEDGDTDLQISVKAFGSTFQSLADRHLFDIRKRQKLYKVECFVFLSGNSFLDIDEAEGLDREVIAIVNAILKDLNALRIAPINLGADRSTIKNSSLSAICGGEHISKNLGLPEVAPFV